MDDMDRAQEREQEDRDRALQAAQQRIAASFTPRDPAVAGLCLDCDNAIEPARIAALRGACSRCIDCATRYEHHLREYRT